MTRRYYAAQSPRGFGNETNVFSFSTAARRDRWVSRHKDDGDVNAASQGAYSITAREMRQIAGYRGDAVTESFNSGPEFIV